MKILVTGATGFVGGSVARALIARGEEVRVLARRPQRAGKLAAAGAEVAAGDLADAAGLARAAAGRDAVIHCAGVPRPASRRAFRRVHVEGTRRLLAAARAAGVRRLVNVASQSVIFAGRHLRGADESTPYPERFIDPYSATKAEAEALALAASGPELEVTSVRPAVVWGRGDTTLLPILARLARGPLGIPAAGPGDNLEASCHIANTVTGILAALDSPAAAGRAYFLLDPFQVGWREFLGRQLEAAGIRPRFFPVPPALARPAAWALDRAAGLLGLPVPLARFGLSMAVTDKSYATTRARDELGYRPRVGFEAGLADLAAWVRELGGPRALVALGKR